MQSWKGFGAMHAFSQLVKVLQKFRNWSSPDPSDLMQNWYSSILPYRCRTSAAPFGDNPHVIGDNPSDEAGVYDCFTADEAAIRLGSKQNVASHVFASTLIELSLYDRATNKCLYIPTSSNSRVRWCQADRCGHQRAPSSVGVSQRSRLLVACAP